MHHNCYTKLSITLETSQGPALDDTNAVTTVISSEMSDCSVHAWFKLFERVLLMAGFSENTVMQGGAQLAFNELRSVEDMRKVAEIYDLRLLEDIKAYGNGSGSEDLA